MRNRQGQVGLLLLVIMGLVVGIALSLSSRSLSDTVISRQESESSQAFQLAETGVEQALNAIRGGNIPDSLNLGNDGVFSGNASVVPIDSVSLYVKEGEQAHLNLEGYTAGSVLISWTKKTDSSENLETCSDLSGSSAAAIEVLVYKSNGSALFDYYNPSGCSIANGFAESSSGSDEYRSYVNFSIPANALAARVRPIYNNATISITGSGLATQFYLIQSLASGGDAKKEIEVQRSLDAPSSVFDYAIFSGSTIEK